jgi:NAD(P)-dependent dehydrogenase (short-subunit alcohol dehydrogenase family)
MPVAIDLSGHHALVTGAGKGIGREICLELARAGADVFAVSRTREELASLGAEVERIGARYGFQVADIRGPSTAQRLVSEAAEAIGDVDILINNAGIARNALAEHVTEAEWDATLDTNLKAAFFLAQAVGRGMLARGYGRIVNVTSAAALAGLAEHAAYCASKAGLGMITKVLAIEWGGRGVTVNAVAPTVILTPLGEQVWGAPEKGGPMLAKIPVGRFGKPIDVATVVAFLVSDHASLINGETIAIDGGYTAQ